MGKQKGTDMKDERILCVKRDKLFYKLNNIMNMSCIKFTYDQLKTLKIANIFFNNKLTIFEILTNFYIIYN